MVELLTQPLQAAFLTKVSALALTETKASVQEVEPVLQEMAVLL